MALEEIKKVAQAEATHKADKEAAMAKGQEEIAKAKEEAAAKIAKAKSEAQEQVRTQLQGAEAEGKTAAQTTLNQAKSRCDSQRQSAGDKLTQAANLITERVVNSQWQS
ncbi:MAG: hypothetical protein R3Y63_06700 [Eubacteriales bacterium]